MLKPGKAVFTYFACNVETFKRIMASWPDKMPQATQAYAACKLIYNNSLTNTGQFLQTQMCIARLQKPIHKEIIEHMYANFQAVYKAALDLEIIRQDNKAAKPVTMAAVGETSPSPLPPATFAPNNHFKCQYCKKPGHLHQDCYKRKKNSSTVVDAQGKP
jgi:hypothetical protein